MKNMNKIIRLLAVAAVVQLLFVVVTHMGGNTLAQHSNDDVVLAFDKSQVDHLRIEQKAADVNNDDDKQAVKVNLIKKDGQWQTEAGFPVTAGKVEGLLDKLAGLKHGLPVATSSSALSRFKVAEDDYQRLITLQNGDKKLAALYLGSGAGARQTHARSDTQGAVYTVTMGVYDAPTKAEDWQDKSLLKLSAKEVSEVTFSGMTFKPETTSDKSSMTMWKTDALPANKIVNQKAINESIEKLASLSFSKVLGKVLGKEKQSEYGLDKPVLHLSLKHKGKARDYQFGKLKDKDDYVLKVSDRDEYFQIASYTGKPLVEGISKDKWLLDKPKAEVKEKPKLDAKAETQAVTSPASTPVKEAIAPAAAPAMQQADDTAKNPVEKKEKNNEESK